jgi:hypothetical protein
MPTFNTNAFLKTTYILSTLTITYFSIVVCNVVKYQRAANKIRAKGIVAKRK